jgi:hypothetical protein
MIGKEQLLRENPVIIFLHIPKAGGTSLARYALNAYPQGKAVQLNNTSSAELYQTIQMILTERPWDYQLIFATHLAGVGVEKASTHRPCYYVTMIREPIARLVSHYHYILHHTHHPMHERFKQFASVEEGVQHLRMNSQTLMLAGVSVRTECTPEILEQAKHNLENLFAAVGVLERFDESLMLYKQVLGWPMPAYLPPENVGRTDKSPISAALRQQLYEQNQFDVALYRHVEALLDAQIASLSTGFRRDMQLYRVVKFSTKLSRFARKSLKHLSPRF